MSSSLMSHIKAFHQERRHHAGSAKSAFKNGMDRMMSLPSALKHHSGHHHFEASGSEQPQRAKSMMASPMQSSQLQHKVLPHLPLLLGPLSLPSPPLPSPPRSFVL